MLTFNKGYLYCRSLKSRDLGTLGILQNFVFFS